MKRRGVIKYYLILERYELRLASYKSGIVPYKYTLWEGKVWKYLKNRRVDSYYSLGGKRLSEDRKW